MKRTPKQTVEQTVKQTPDLFEGVCVFGVATGIPVRLYVYWIASLFVGLCVFSVYSVDRLTSWLITFTSVIEVRRETDLLTIDHSITVSVD